ncbi:MAG: threonine synthase [Zestosphaera tikiterensis]|uniref:Threonine synthase n=1 Tax=Zestosphaera tikiterensis TaxID=1973259 RepID=A0A2R7Y9G3_9CREN|nr:MAG: threonine synthase [Zestosphaera tikiterensis]
MRRCVPNTALVCDLCGRKYSLLDRRAFCVCGGLLHIELPLNKAEELPVNKDSRSLWRYRALIPLPQDVEVVSLGEGLTPLIRLGRSIYNYKVKKAFIKFEGSNPTGSFKDRGMTVVVSLAKYLGFKALISASTGNTASSMSAYARRAGLLPIVLVPRGSVAGGKVSQLKLYGAKVVEIDGSFDEAMSLVTKMAKDVNGDFYVVNSVNPWRIEGQKTVAYEIYEEVGVPDWIVVPVGNGGNIYSIWKGFKELLKLGLISKAPKVLAVQASGASPIAKAFKSGEYKPVSQPKTLASAIRIGNPVHWYRALNVLNESGGYAVTVNDEEILKAHIELARNEGIGVETSSATTLAGLKLAVNEGIIHEDEKVVLIATGHALKEPEVLNNYGFEAIAVKNALEALEVLKNSMR